MSVDEMSVDEMSVDEMSVDEMSVDEMSVDELSWNLSKVLLLSKKRARVGYLFSFHVVGVECKRVDGAIATVEVRQPNRSCVQLHCDVVAEQ